MGKYTRLLIIPLLTLFQLSYSQLTQVSGPKMTLLFMGDIMGHDEQLWSAKVKDSETYDFDSVFNHIKPVIEEADFAIGNFEVTLAGPPYRGYPVFSAPSALAEACREAGIDCLVTANNHAADHGEKGLSGTIRRLDSLGIRHTGTFAGSPERIERQPLILEKGELSVAILNYTYSTNGRTVPETIVVNRLDTSLIASDIVKARKMNADIVILFLHWGNEYENEASARQNELAKFLLASGADIIIGSHPHVIQKMTWQRTGMGKPGQAVYYSLGNFLSNQVKPGTEGGAMARIELSMDKGRVVISDAGYYLTWVYKPVIDYKKYFYVLPCARFEFDTAFFMNESMFYKMKDFVSRSRQLLRSSNKGVTEIIYNGNAWLYDN
jgi:poly-gamma-glutamate synthesis protein (capsule biosynthesis protein)